MRRFIFASLVLAAGCHTREIDLGNGDAAPPAIDGGPTGGAGGSTGGGAGSGAGGDGGRGTGGDMGGGAGGGGGDAMPPDFDVAKCPCTRRPGPTRSWECPVGIDESATQVIGPAGGTIKLHGQQSQLRADPDVMLTIQPRILEQNRIVTITETSIPPPVGYHDDSPVYRIEPNDLNLSLGMPLTLPHGNTSSSYTWDGYVDAGMDAWQLIWVSYDEGASWSVLTNSRPNTVVSTGTLSTGGLYFVGFPKRGIELRCP